MDKLFWNRSIFCGLLVFAVLGVFLFAGCSHFRGSEDYDAFSVTPETLHQIEPLELKERRRLGTCWRMPWPACPAWR